MKIQSLFTKSFWLGLIFTVVMVGTIFKLTPSFAHSTTMPPTQLSAARATIAQNLIAQAGGTSLYHRLKGYNGIARIIDSAAPRIFNDPLIGKYFIGLSTNSKQRLRELLVEQFCQATGGPCIYLGRTMKLSHGGIGLNDSEFQAFVNDVAASLDENNVGQQEKDEVLAFVNSLENQIVEK